TDFIDHFDDFAAGRGSDFLVESKIILILSRIAFMCFPVFHRKEGIGISMGTIHIMIVDELVSTAPEDEPFLVDRHGVGHIRYTFTIVLKDSIGLYCQHMYHVILAEVDA